MSNQDLFSQADQTVDDAQTPLAHQARPMETSDFIGLDDLISKYPFLDSQRPSSIILWGPPGCGKTTLSALLAKKWELEIYNFNAVLSGLPELRKLIEKAKDSFHYFKKPAIIFIDEIHRFNKSQQDALLPHVEQGTFVLIGATTEYPQTSINRALLSRMQTVELRKLSTEETLNLVNRAFKKFDIQIKSELLPLIAGWSDGDARRALNYLEVISKTPLENQTQESVEKIILAQSRQYDRNNDRHYDVISSFIKSMRGSDPDSAILWLAVMLDGGEDPVFIARRLLIFASEDVGNADPQALTMANSTLQAVSQIGMPEARIILAQATTYLASTVKSNASYLAINEALEYVRARSTIEVPPHLKNHGPDSKNYKYPHNFPHHFTEQEYANENVKGLFYRPTELGAELKIKERLKNLWRSLRN